MANGKDDEGRAPRLGSSGQSAATGAPGAGRVYTRQGDRGQTSLYGGQRVSKRDPRVAAYGTVDELNAVVGIARELARQASAEAMAELADTLLCVQHQLLTVGALLAGSAEDVRPDLPRVTQDDVTALEAEMDRRSAELEPLSSFVMPGGCPLNAQLHLARTVCRRAERLCVALAEEHTVDPVLLAFLNRLGDAFFVWSRWASAKLGAAETRWTPGRR